MEDNDDIRTVQELLGHTDVSTTMIYTHVLNRGGRGVRSPVDGLAIRLPVGQCLSARGRARTILTSVGNPRRITAVIGNVETGICRSVYLMVRQIPMDAEALIEKETVEIQSAMAALGRRLESGDDSQLLHWVIPERLACAHRPLRHHPRYGGSGANLGGSATELVFEWVERMRTEGIKSFISLMHDRDIRCYQSLELGAADLMEFYKKLGFEVAHIPWEDPHHKKATEADKRKTLLRVRSEALRVYPSLPTAVVIQCSAGIDRSAPVAAFIKYRVAL